jgi:hypothetical protein
MAEDRIPLRDLGERLMIYNKSKSRGRFELLGLLISEKLIARFDYPSNERPQINVPAAHWLKNVKMNEFRKALDGNNKNKGDYLVDPEKFAAEYLDWFSRNRRLPEDTDELSAALRAGSTKAEVYVLAEDWEKFAKDLPASQHSTTPKKSSRGVSENANWSAILVEVAVELLNESQSPVPPQITVIAAHALERVTAREKTKLPGPSAVEKKVSEIISRYWKQ